MNDASWITLFKSVTLGASLLTVISFIGLWIFTNRKESRQADDFKNLQSVAETTRDYADMAQLNPAGLPFKEGTGIRFDTPLSNALRDCLVVRGDNLTYKIDADYEARYRQIIADNPRFPFGYLALAETLRHEGKAEWRDVARKGLDIFKRTERQAADIALQEQRAQTRAKETTVPLPEPVTPAEPKTEDKYLTRTISFEEARRRAAREMLRGPLDH